MRYLAGLLLLALTAVSQAGPSWTPLDSSASGGGISNYGGDSIHASLSLDSSGNPAVAWQQQGANGNYEIWFRRWNGSGWVELANSASGGGVSNTQMLSYSPSLALDASGNPCIAWHEDGDDFEIFYRQWNGSAWVGLDGSDSGGGISQTDTDSMTPHLTFNASGNPTVAWSEDNGAGYPEILYRRWNGSAWEGVGGSESGGGVSATSTPSRSPSVGYDASGNPVIAWSERLSSSNEEI
ncbi:MAG TPA: hypothetical protein VFC86_01775, partial [Planctomycetota bacterium]|nr:hypothetical protein [Planctomycetota bacterium]